MSDSAFKSAPFSGYTTEELLASIARNNDKIGNHMQAEVDRRVKVKAGDITVMTPGERLRYYAQVNDDGLPRG